MPSLRLTTAAGRKRDGGAGTGCVTALAPCGGMQVVGPSLAQIRPAAFRGRDGFVAPTGAAEGVVADGRRGFERPGEGRSAGPEITIARESAHTSYGVQLPAAAYVAQIVGQAFAPKTSARLPEGAYAPAKGSETHLIATL